MLQRSPLDLVNSPAELLLGEAQRSELATFLTGWRRAPKREAEIESCYTTPGGEQRMLRIVGYQPRWQPTDQRYRARTQ